MTRQTRSASPYEVVYDPVRLELARVVANVAALGEEESVREDAVAGHLAHVLEAPGKRLRPAITLLAARLWGKPSDLDVTMATGVELLHIATLIHDDTVDGADLRRGQPTPSSLWGRNVAVLLGDYVFAAAARFVCDTNSVRLVRRFAETIMELSRGELNELLDGRTGSVTRAAYFRRIYDKTASLFTTAAESGAILGDGSEADIRRLRDFGYNLGMAYQVQDDVLDFESTSEEMGKPAGADLRAGVLTLPAIMLIEQEPEWAGMLAALADAGLGDDHPPEREADRRAGLAEAITRIRDSGAVEESCRVAQGYVDSAREAIQGLPESPECAALQTLADVTETRRS